MHELDDNVLLRQYAEQNSEAAFAALVTRHVDKVYSVALRHTRNTHAAEEITQAVFVILTRKANKLSRHVVLSGWLYETARLTALTYIRSEIRRARREQEAHMQSAFNQNADEAWQYIAPLLDDALAKLNETDRHAIVLRYFDGKSLGEVGAAQGASEEAAKKRVTRAVEKLRGFFTKRGVTLTATVLTAAISANSVQAASLGLAATVSATAAKGAVVSGSTLTLIKGALKVMTLIKVKKAIGIGLGALLLVGTTTLVAQHELRHTCSFPYKTADTVWQLIHSVDKTKFEMHAFIYSTNRTVDSRDLQVNIQSASKGVISVQLGTNGEIIDIPHDEALRRENPAITVNPPQGIRMIFRGVIPVPESLTFRYNQLGDGVAEANHLFAKGADN
ncbi:MAG TPA: sigma-70 family RNA polymerase sigma factor, partial [Candidatus Paceibacterota bacterium]|nr:sigma-70 family RNA polymerase sigma factor [Candidatus Paceibacterota bacterium]